MKKFFLSFALITAALSVSAVEDLKPEAGDISTEVNISLFNGQQNVSVDGIKLRYFFSENIAARLTLSYSDWTHSAYDENMLPGGSTPSRLSQSVSNFGFRLGAEYHFKGNARLAPYVGAEFGFNFIGTSDKFHLKNSNGDLLATSYEYKGTQVNNQSSGTQFGIGAFAGLDFYIYKGFYTGVEFGFYYKSHAEGKWNKKDYDAVAKKWNETSSTDLGKNSNIYSTTAFEAVPSLKLGWKF